MLITINPSLHGGDSHIPSPASTLSELQPQNVSHVHPAVLPNVLIHSLLDNHNVPCPLHQHCLSQIYSTQVAKPKLKHAVLHFMTFSTPSPTTTYRTKLHLFRRCTNISRICLCLLFYHRLLHSLSCSLLTRNSNCLLLPTRSMLFHASLPLPSLFPQFLLPFKNSVPAAPPLTFLSSSSTPCRLGQVPFILCNPA